MSFLRLANPKEYDKVFTEDGEDWVLLKKELNKGDVNKVIINAPTNEEDRAGALNFAERFAEIAIVDWSVLDENEKKVTFSAAKYRELTFEAAKWLDKVLGDHLKATIGADVEELEGKEEN